MRFKRSRPVGERCHKSRLTSVQVLEIRKLWQSGCKNYSLLAKSYGVAKTTTRNIILRRSWRHV